VAGIVANGSTTPNRKAEEILAPASVYFTHLSMGLVA